MAGYNFASKERLSRLQLKAQRTKVEVYGTIHRIVERKKAQGIVPARATERELRDVFEERHFEHLEFLVSRGAAIKTRAINYDTYEIDYPVYEELMARMRDLAR